MAGHINATTHSIHCSGARGKHRDIFHHFVNGLDPIPRIQPPHALEALLDGIGGVIKLYMSGSQKGNSLPGDMFTAIWNAIGP